MSAFFEVAGQTLIGIGYVFLLLYIISKLFSMGGIEL